MELRILHVFSDEKFIDKHIVKYEDCSFHNSFIYLKNINRYVGNNPQVMHVVPNSTEYFTQVKNVESFDFVILYYLNLDKLNFLDDIKGAKVKVIWSFYGIELYSMSVFKYKMLSHKTQILLGSKINFINIDIIKEVCRSFYAKLTGKETYHQKLMRLLQRVNFFLWYNPFEYEYLNAVLHEKLPTFLLATLNNKLQDIKPLKLKNNSVIIGNSASPYNNHLNALAIFEKNNFKGNIDIPFAYAGTATYNRRLKAYVKNFAIKIRFLEGFVPYESYIAELNNHSAAVFPSFRQLGLGNIFIAVRCGLKIYLSTNNPTYHWLVQSGFKIYSIEFDLEQDIQSQTLCLAQDFIELNNECYDKFLSSKNNQLFFEKLMNISSSPDI